MLKRFRKFQTDELSSTNRVEVDYELLAEINGGKSWEASCRELEHQYYAGIALQAMIEKWDGDPEKGRFVIAHKAHLIADAMVNADWERREQSDG